MKDIQTNVALDSYSTIGIGGRADYFCICKTEKDLVEALEFAKEKKLHFFILGQGSNTLFHDNGFRGLIIKLDFKGIVVDLKNPGFVTAKAGEVWDDFVQTTIEHNLTGIECLSGIPGLVGAAPIQNVGAYGQETSQTLRSLKALDCQTFEVVTIDAKECEFDYRFSRFKGKDKGRFVIVEVNFQLAHDKEPKILYQELFKYVKSRLRYKTLESNKARLEALRSAVIEIRRGKSMVVDKTDPNSKSLGSFFLNPIVSKQQCQILLEKYPDMPYFNFSTSVKLSAAWLLENSGFPKGYIHKNVGTSQNHCLAIINRGGGTQQEILELCELMKKEVYKKFDVSLAPEPIIC